MAMIEKVPRIVILACFFVVISGYGFAQAVPHNNSKGLSWVELDNQFVSLGTKMKYKVLFDRYKLDQKTRNSFNNVECELGEWKIRIDLTDPSSDQNAMCTVSSMKSGKVVLRHELPSTLWRGTIENIVTQDLNGDGYPDIIITNAVMGTQYLASLSYMTLLLFTQNGVHPLEVSTFGPDLNGWQDLNGDGKAEFICEAVDQWDFKPSKPDQCIDRRIYAFYNIFAFQENFHLINVTSSFDFSNTCFESRLDRSNKGFFPIKCNKLPKKLQHLATLTKPIAYDR
ncbi:MAG: VCBS repeat-containing protein [Acidobacteria bacterium]|nr:VCBS repeat-containing protein [Acidobacteriota bacterium]